MTDERHSYISQGISREAFQNAAVRQTSLPENENLWWFLHAHTHSETVCNERCQIVCKGKVESVTQMGVANTSSDA